MDTAPCDKVQTSIKANGDYIKTKHSVSTYQNDWQNDFRWVRPIEGDPYFARCVICKHNINIFIGARALKTHKRRKMHKTNIMNKFPCQSSTLNVMDNCSIAQDTTVTYNVQNERDSFECLGKIFLFKKSIIITW